MKVTNMFFGGRMNPLGVVAVGTHPAKKEGKKNNVPEK